MKTRNESCLYTYSLPSPLKEQKFFQLKGDTETSVRFDRLKAGWGKSHVHEYVMNSKGKELIQNLCNTQSNSFPVHIMKQMISEKKSTKKQTHNNHHQTKAQKKQNKKNPTTNTKP